MYRGLLKSIELPWLHCGIEVRGGESGRHQETESNAYPFTPKIYPNDLVSTIDISRLLLARNGQVTCQWIALTAPKLLCKARRVHSLSRFRYPEHDPDAEAPISDMMMLEKATGTT